MHKTATIQIPMARSAKLVLDHSGDLINQTQTFSTANKYMSLIVIVYPQEEIVYQHKLIVYFLLQYDGF